MTPLEYLKQIAAVLPVLARETGNSTLGLYAAFVYEFLRYHITLDEFSASRTYDMSARKMAQYLTVRRRNQLTARYFNAHATADDLNILDDKRRFNAYFAPFVHRDWLDMAVCTEQELAAFLAKNPVFLAKDALGMQGDRIAKYQAGSLDQAAFYRDHRGKDVILEGFIRQHPAMAAPNPSSVNTIRFMTVCLGGEVMPVGACMRCGGKDAVVDNFHKGGLTYPVDVDCGVVTGMGQDLMGRYGVLRHPSTGFVMPGFQVPHWDQVKQAVTQAALMLPQVGVIGWDVAVTEEGVEFIEGNNTTDPIVVQLDGRGRYRQVRDFAERHGS